VKLAISLSLLFLTVGASFAEEPTGWHRLVGILQYLESDYPVAAKSGSKSELQEQRSFADEAVAAAQELGAAGQPFLQKIQSIRDRIYNAEDPRVVSRDCAQLVDALVQAGGLTRSPKHPPDLSKGQELYAVGCAACHGSDGSGRSTIAHTLNPRPTNFLDPEAMNNLDPYKAFNSVTFGINGTSMPSYSTLDEEDRWAVAFFIFTLRQPPCDHRPPQVSLERLANSTDAQLTAMYGAKELACLRRRSPDVDKEQSLLIARAGIVQALKLGAEGNKSAAARAVLDAYLNGIEPIEPVLRLRDPARLRELEQLFIRTRLAAEKDYPQLLNVGNELLRAIDLAQKGNPSAGDFWSIFWLALMVIVREGFEAGVVIAALLAVLRKMDQRQHERLVHLGWSSAIIVGAIAFFFARRLLGGADRELLEGIVALIAVGMMIYAALWLNARSNIRKLMGRLRGRMQVALGRGSGLGLFTIAFTAVLRESFETAIFLQGLSIDSPSASLWGALAGGGVLVGLVIFVNRVGYRLPMKALFDFSTALLLATAIVVLGKGMHTLQTLGILRAHPISIFQIEPLGIYPDAYTICAQLLLAIAPFLWLLRRRFTPSVSGLPAGDDSPEVKAK